VTYNFDIETGKQQRLTDFNLTKQQGITKFIEYAKAVIKTDFENAKKELEKQQVRTWKQKNIKTIDSQTLKQK